MVQVQHGGGVRRRQQQRQTGDGRQPDAEREAAEGGHRRHLDGADAGGHVQAEADGAAGEDGKAERVPERVGDEGGEEDARVGDQPAQVTQRQHLVGAEQPVAERREAQGREDLPARDGVQVRKHALDVQVRELTVQHGHHEGEDQQRRERSRPSARRAAPAPRASSQLGSRGTRCAAAAGPSASAACSGCGAAARRPRPCGACSPRCSPGSCPRTRPPASRPRRTGCGSRCDRGTSDRGR